MAFEGDDCSFCRAAKREIKILAKNLRCARNATCAVSSSSSSSISSSQPVVLQHFPLYRNSDSLCSEPDEASPLEKNVPFKEKWDCISRNSTRVILRSLDPRLVLSGHTHSGCLTRHRSPIIDASTGRRRPDVPEFSVSSFSWRNRNNPAFLLALFTPESHAVSKCLMPEESSVLGNYFYGTLALLLYFFFPWRRCMAEINERYQRRRNVGAPGKIEEFHDDIDPVVDKSL